MPNETPTNTVNNKGLDSHNAYYNIVKRFHKAVTLNLSDLDKLSSKKMKLLSALTVQQMVKKKINYLAKGSYEITLPTTKGEKKISIGITHDIAFNPEVKEYHIVDKPIEGEVGAQNDGIYQCTKQTFSLNNEGNRINRIKVHHSRNTLYLKVIKTETAIETPKNNNIVVPTPNPTVVLNPVKSTLEEAKQKFFSDDIDDDFDDNFDDNLTEEDLRKILPREFRPNIRPAEKQQQTNNSRVVKVATEAAVVVPQQTEQSSSDKGQDDALTEDIKQVFSKNLKPKNHLPEKQQEENKDNNNNAITAAGVEKKTADKDYDYDIDLAKNKISDQNSTSKTPTKPQESEAEVTKKFDQNAHGPFKKDETRNYFFMSERPGISTSALIRKKNPRKYQGRAQLIIFFDDLHVLRNHVRDLKKIHDKDYVHLDIKPDNSIYDPKKRRVNFIDFGLAKSTSYEGDLATFKGKEANKLSSGYAAPELLGFNEKGKQCNPQKALPSMDIYSLGIVFLQVITKNPQLYVMPESYLLTLQKNNPTTEKTADDKPIASISHSSNSLIDSKHSDNAKEMEILAAKTAFKKFIVGDKQLILNDIDEIKDEINKAGTVPPQYLDEVVNIIVSMLHSDANQRTKTNDLLQQINRLFLKVQAHHSCYKSGNNKLLELIGSDKDLINIYQETTKNNSDKTLGVTKKNIDSLNANSLLILACEKENEKVNREAYEKYVTDLQDKIKNIITQKDSNTRIDSDVLKNPQFYSTTLNNITRVLISEDFTPAEKIFLAQEYAKDYESDWSRNASRKVSTFFSKHKEKEAGLVRTFCEDLKNYDLLAPISARTDRAETILQI